MKPTFNVFIAFFAALPLMLLSYQLGAPGAVTAAAIGEYLAEPALKAPPATASTVENPIKRQPQKKPGAPDLATSAASALAWDFKVDVFLYANNIDEKRPIASLTKLVTAAVVLDHAQPQESVAVSLEAVREDGDSARLKDGEVLTVYDLLAAALLESSNDAAYALAEHVGKKLSADPEFKSTPLREFVRSMNQKFNETGLVHSNFTDPSGLEDNQSFSTARDLSGFIKHVRENPKYLPIWDILKLKTLATASQNGVAKHEFKNTNPFLGEVPDFIGGKTGYTDNALGNMVLVLGGPHNAETIYIVLGSNDRIGDMRKLVEWTSEWWQWPRDNFQ